MPLLGRLLLLHFKLRQLLLKRYNLQPHAQPVMWNQLFVQLSGSGYGYGYGYGLGLGLGLAC